MKKNSEISFDNWSRRELHEFFLNNFQFPHTTLTAQVNVEKLVRFCKEREFSLFHGTLFFVLQSLNEIEEFRQRIRPDKIVQWEKLNPSYTILGEDKRFLFCDVEFTEDLATFHKRSVEAARKAKEEAFEDDRHKEDDRVFISCIPWVNFTQISHPVHSAKFDSTPRVAWGKIEQTSEGATMPLNIQAHHSLVDGYHFGLFFKNLQDRLDALEISQEP